MTVNPPISPSMWHCDKIQSAKIFIIMARRSGVYFILPSPLSSLLPLYKYGDIFLNILTFLFLQPKESCNLLLPAKSCVKMGKYWQNILHWLWLCGSEAVKEDNQRTKKNVKIKSLLAGSRGGEGRPAGPDGSSLARMDADDCYLVLGGAGWNQRGEGRGEGSAWLSDWDTASN